MTPLLRGIRGHRRLRQLLWFIALWAGGVLTVAAVSYGIRWWLGHA